MTNPAKDSPFVVLVTFETTPDNHATALNLISDYISSFLSQQTGFIKSTLHKSLDEKSIMHYAHWETAQAFKQFSSHAKDHPLLPKLLKYNPQPRFYGVYENYTQTS